MLLRYETTAADQIAKLERYASASPVARLFPLLAYAGIVGLSWLSACLFYIRQGDRNQLYIASAALALFLTLALPWLYGRYQAHFLGSVLTTDQLRGLIGLVELSVDETHIEEVGPLSTIRARWADVVAVELDAERTMIMVAPLVAIAIPRRAFTDDAARGAYDEQLKAWFTASRA